MREYIAWPVAVHAVGCGAVMEAAEPAGDGRSGRLATASRNVAPCFALASRCLKLKLKRLRGRNRQAQEATMASNELVASSGASHILGVSTNTVRAWMRRGDLPVAVATPVGAIYRKDDVIRLAAQREAARHADEK